MGRAASRRRRGKSGGQGSSSSSGSSSGGSSKGSKSTGGSSGRSSNNRGGQAAANKARSDAKAAATASTSSTTKGPSKNTGPNVGDGGFNLGGWNTKPNEHGGQWGFAASAGKNPATGKPYSAGEIHSALKAKSAAESAAKSRAKDLSGVLTPGGVTPSSWNINIPQSWKTARNELGLITGKAVSDFSQTDLGQGLLNRIDTNPDSWQNKFIAGTVDKLTEGARDYARDQPGVQGLVGGIQAGKLERRLDRGDLSGAFDTISGTFSLAEKYGGKIPTAGDWAKGKLGFGSEDRAKASLDRTPNALQKFLAGTGGRDYIRGIGNRGSRGMTIRNVDPNKIGNQTANPYLTSGTAAQDESKLRDFWIEQNRLNTAAEQRLKDIETDRSRYSTLVTDLGAKSTAYSKELDRLGPLGEQYTSEIARLEPFGQQYIDELARLKPYDEQFKTAIADLTKGRDEFQNQKHMIGGGDGLDKFSYQQDIARYGKEWDQAIADTEKDYKSYQDLVAKTTSDQTAYQSHLSGIQKDYGEYQSYLKEVQSGQQALSDYTVQVDRERGELENYAKAFTSAREQSAKDARSYTIRSQQGISSGLRSSVSGIRASRGYSSFGRNRNRSAKKRFNRDFRIGSFGDTSTSQINI